MSEISHEQRILPQETETAVQLATEQVELERVRLARMFPEYNEDATKAELIARLRQLNIEAESGNSETADRIRWLLAHERYTKS